MANCFTRALLLGPSTLEPFILSSGSSNRTSGSESPVHSYNHYSYRLGQTLFGSEVGMASADLGPVDEGFNPLNPINAHFVVRSGSEGSVNQGEISSDHTESINLRGRRDGNGASAQIPDVQIVGVRNPEADNTGIPLRANNREPINRTCYRESTARGPSFRD